MTAFTPRIDALLEEYHVMSLAVCAGHQHWAAPVFYVFDPLRMRLLFVTDPSTRHGLLLEQTGRAIATVSGQDRSIPFLRGLQMEGDAWRLEYCGQEIGRTPLYGSVFYSTPSSARLLGVYAALHQGDR
ncbi:pyridoxamine 5'-phosphate oxidase family protein [Komagataeibacter rhaeticus]|nr:pyridoxamine 5'-phosphate oxidase family protein [Komagataeibacter rhaeticus]